MKFDLTRLPTGEMIIGFLIVSLVVTFGVAFAVVDLDSGGGEGGDMGGGPTATPVTGSTEIIMGDNFFDPSDLTVQAGDTLTINIVSQGVATHNMHIAQADGTYSVSGNCSTDGDDPCSDPDVVTPGSTATLVWEVPDAPGTTIPFRCDFHQTDMTGSFTIAAAGSGETAAAE